MKRRIKVSGISLDSHSKVKTTSRNYENHVMQSHIKQLYEFKVGIQFEMHLNINLNLNQSFMESFVN